MNARIRLGRGHIVQFLLSFVATCLLLTGGFLFVSLMQTEEEFETNSNEDDVRQQTSTNRQNNYPIATSSGSIPLLARFNHQASTFERSLILDNVLEGMDSEHLKELFAQTTTISPYSQQIAIQDELVRRFASIDPVQSMGLLDEGSTLQQKRLTQPIFQEWASTDLDSAVEFASKLYPFFLREVAYGAILEIREDLTLDEKNHIGRRLKLTEFAIQDAVGESDVATTKSNDVLWHETLNSNRPFNLKYSALVRLAQSRIDQDGLSAILEISKSTPDWRTRRGVLLESIRWAARSDPKSTFEFALSSFRESNSFLIIDALEYWVEREPENALSTVSSLESSTLRRELYKSAISTWANYEPRNLLSNINLLPSELRYGARLRAFYKIRDLSSQEVAKLVAHLPPGDSTSSIAALVSSWKNYAFEEALDWVLSNSHQNKKSVTRQLFEQLSPINADLAFRRIMDRPLDEKEIGLEADIIAHLVASDIEAATNMMPRIRNERTRKAAIRRTAQQLGMWARWDTAWEFGGHLPASERTSFYDSVVVQWSGYAHRQGIFSSIENLPNSEIRSRAALRTIQFKELRNDLSQSDETKLKSYLLEKDAEELERTVITVSH